MAPSQDPPNSRRRGSGDSLNRPRLAVLLLSLLGMAIAAVLLYLHYKLRATSGAYTSFCNIGGGFNCDVVLTSPYSQLLGYPVELWGFLTYVLIAAAALASSDGGVRDRPQSNQLLIVVFLSTWAAVFSIYMAAVAAFLVEAFCINCVALYLTNFGLAAAAWIWARRAGTPGGEAGAPIGKRQIALGAIAIGLLLAAGGTLQNRSSSTFLGYLTGDQVRARAPDFYRWYLDQPVARDISPGRHLKGPAGAKIRIVEFSDFECGHCRKAFRDLSRVMKRYLGEVRLEFRHFPLDSKCNAEIKEPFHRAACSYAVASECAGEQGKFWEYHDLLFSGREPLDEKALVGYARDLGLDSGRFFRCLNNADVLARVKGDIEMAKRLEVHSTPTMFINGRMIVGALEPAGYEYAIAIEDDRRPRK